MTRFSQVTAALRRKSLGQYALLTLCCFVSVLLITAYASMMGSPTVLSVFPEGGDSRKQMTMIFVLAVLGCGVFTTYAACSSATSPGMWASCWPWVPPRTSCAGCWRGS